MLAPTIVTPNEVLRIGLVKVGFSIERQAAVCRKENLKRFKSHYGSLPVVYSTIWEDLHTTDIAAAKIGPHGRGWTLDNFFMALHFLKVYPRALQQIGTFGGCVDTAAKWAWNFAGKIAALKGMKVSRSHQEFRRQSSLLWLLILF